MVTGEMAEEQHRAQVLAYVRFAQNKRQVRLKSVAACFQDVRESRLLEATYTAEEVAELLSGLRDVVLGELESELMDAAHSNVLLLQQLFSQAEHWHLRLRTDISELENRRLLEEVAELERGAAGAGHQGRGHGSRLAPLAEGGPSELLQAEIARLAEENERLRSRLRALETQATAALDDRRRAEDELSRLRGAQGPETHIPPPPPPEEEDDALERLRQDFQKTLGDQSANQRQLEENLTGTKHQLLRVQEQLAMAEKELDKKFQETSAYRNMKDILSRKNQQMKELRARLAKYEPDD